MDLVILIVVSLILIPVLLYGFVGCGQFGSTSSDSTDRPSNLVATGKNVGHIALEWKYAAAATVSFTLARKGPGETAFNETYRTGILTTTFDDQPIPPGEYRYKVRAVVNAVATDWSDEALAHTLEWKEAYTSQGTFNVPTADFTGHCVVQKMDPAVLKFGGKRVRITVFNGSNQPLNIQRIYVSHPAVTGAPANPTPDPWDSRDPMVQVLEGGIVIGANQSATRDSGEFAFNNNEPLMISFDINSGLVTRWRTAVGISISYDRNNVTEAVSANRSPNYQDRPETVLLVSKIEALN